MSQKIEIGQVAEVLKRELEPPEFRRIFEELNMLIEQESGEEKPPAVKKQLCVLVSDPEGRITTDHVAWVLTLPESESVATVQERIFRAAYDFNASKRGRLYPVSSVGAALEEVPAKHFKEVDLAVRTKVPVLLLKTDNVIPKDTSAQ